MDQVDESAGETQTKPVRGGRRFEAELLDRLRGALSTGGSLLEFAQERGVPESTVRHWVSRAQASGAPQSFIDFVESPEGLQVLHQIVLAAMFTLTQVAGGGVRAVCSFLELSGLWRVVGASFGTQQAAIKNMEEAIVAFGAEERQRLAPTMPPRDITVAQDETFHDNPCLVAIESVSNFILVEEYAENRTTKTWSAAMEQGLKGLPVKVIQATSDEGSSLLSLACQSNVHHSPDLFHPQQDISRATSLPLQRKVEEAEQKATLAAIKLDALLNEVKTYETEPRGPGRRREYDNQLRAAEENLKATESDVEQAKERRQKVREAARAISSSYHPFDLKTGEQRDAAQVGQDLNDQMDRIAQITTEVGLGARCWALLEKARRLLPQMVATIAFVHALIRDKVEALDLTSIVEDIVLRQLIPVCYLEEIVRKAPTAEARTALRATIASLQVDLNKPNSPLAALPADEREQVHRVARECAQLFQRSSSNVEGRNGFLALRHHSIHELGKRKLQALTVVHNYWTRRADGTTAATRFFGQKNNDLFEHLVAKLPPPKRPAGQCADLH